MSRSSIDRHSAPGSEGVPAPLAAAVASAAYLVPYVMSRSTSPSPDHPRIFLWYRWLRKPSFKPPDVAIPAAWVAIETGLAYAGFRLMRARSSPARNRALALLAGNVLGIGGWNVLFFGRRELPTATIAAAALAATSAIYLNETRKVDPPAAVASVPLLGWVLFATVLTAAIWKRNR
jgi:translocator protein